MVQAARIGLARTVYDSPRRWRAGSNLKKRFSATAGVNIGCPGSDIRVLGNDGSVVQAGLQIGLMLAGFRRCTSG